MFKSLLRKPKTVLSPECGAPDISRIIPEFSGGAARIVPKVSAQSDAADGEDGGLKDADRITEDDGPLLLDERHAIVQPESDPLSTDVAQAEPLELSDEVEALSADEWLSADLATLRREAKHFLAEPTSDEKRRAVFLVAHNMRGAAGAYGYPVIERLTGSLCLLLEEDHELASAAPLLNLHVEACRAAVNTQASKASEDLANAVCSALEEQVYARLAG